MIREAEILKNLSNSFGNALKTSYICIVFFIVLDFRLILRLKVVVRQPFSFCTHFIFSTNDERQAIS